MKVKTLAVVQFEISMPHDTEWHSQHPLFWLFSEPIQCTQRYLGLGMIWGFISFFFPVHPIFRSHVLFTLSVQCVCFSLYWFFTEVVKLTKVLYLIANLRYLYFSESRCWLPVWFTEGTSGTEAAEEASGTADGPTQHRGSAPALQDTAWWGAGPVGGVSTQCCQRCHRGW